MDKIIFEKETPVTISLAATGIRNKGMISENPVTYQMTDGSIDSRLFIQNIEVSDIELINCKPDTYPEFILEYQGQTYVIKNAHLFREKIVLNNHLVLCDLFFDNKIPDEIKGQSFSIEKTTDINLSDEPLLSVQEDVSEMEILCSTHEQFFKRSSIDGIRPVYTEKIEEKVENYSGKEIHLYSGNKLVGTLTTNIDGFNLNVPELAQ